MTSKKHAQIQHVETRTLKIKHGVPQLKDSRKKYNVQSDIKALMGRDYEVENIMKFLKNQQDLIVTKK